MKFTLTSLIIVVSLSMVACNRSIPKQYNTTVDFDKVKKMTQKISTKVDPSFVYSYEQSKFVPPEGKTLLIMGQDKKTIAQYNEDYSDKPLPSGWTSYWGITSMYGVDRDSTKEIGDQFGYQNHQQLVDNYPNAVLQSGLWMVGMWDIVKRAGEGKFDNVIYEFSVWAKEIDRPIYLRIGYEFDGEHNAMEPEQYVKAYRNIVDILRAEGVNNIAFVWHSYAAPAYKGHSISDWYPGDDYVDWVGLSLFGHMYSSALNNEAEDVFEFAKTHKKPVMIAEASPINGIEENSLEVWDTWFVNFLSLCYQRNVKAISFINADWTSYPGFTELPWKDARLQNNATIAAAWFKEMEKERYLKPSATLFKQLGYSQ